MVLISAKCGGALMLHNTVQCSDIESMSALPVAACAILGPSNEILYLRSFGDVNAHDFASDDGGLKWPFYFHSALDVVEERVLQAQQRNATNVEQYLGLLLPVDEYRVFGLVSNTKLKFLAIMRDVFVQESNCKVFLKKLQGVYVDSISSPFAVVGAPFESERFHQAVRRLINSFDGQLPPIIGH